MEPAGIFYYRIQDPIVDRETDEKTLEEKILKELRLDGMINAKRGSDRASGTSADRKFCPQSDRKK